MSTSLTAPAFAQPIRHYKDFLTPALHSRFVDAAVVLLGLCYAEAVWLGEWDWLWQWFPFGPAGVRTLLLFISCLAILVLRVAQIHVEPRTTIYPLETLYQQVTSIKAYQTIAWYGFSALMYCEIYIWSASTDLLLHFVISMRSVEYMRLNERPIFFRTLFVFLGLVQACMHLYHDYDNINIPVTKFTRNAQKTTMNTLPTPRTQIQESIQIYITRAFQYTCSAIVIGVLVYTIFLRQLLWRISYMLVGTVYPLSKQGKATRAAGLMDLVGRFFVTGFLLVMLWEVSNAAFTAYARQEPTKRGFPLTRESKNPNGTLITGLKTTKPLVKTFAYWETVLIVLRYEERRQMLYIDKSRPEDASCSHIWQSCMNEIARLMTRLESYDKPVISTLELIRNPSSLLSTPPPKPEIKTLPRIAAKTAINDATVTVATPPPKPTFVNAVGANIDKIVKSNSRDQKYGSATPVTTSKKLLQHSVSGILSPNVVTSQTKALQSKIQPDSITVASLKQTLDNYKTAFLNTRYAWPIQQTFSRRATAVVAGVPYSDLSSLTDAITIIVEIVARSTTEDKHGFVAPKMASAVSTFSRAIVVLKNFKQTLEPHWTDVGFQEASGANPEKGNDNSGGRDNSKGSRDVEAVDQLITTFKSGLERIITTVAEYAEAFGLSDETVKQAKGLVSGD